MASDILLTADADARLDYLSSRFFSYSGSESAGDVAAAWEQAIHPDDRAPHRANWKRARRTESPFEQHLRLLRADGTYADFQLRCQPVRDPAGVLTSWACSCTERTEVAEARASAERAIQAKTRFFAAAGHDLRQPFQAMRLFLHILERRPLDDETRKVARSLADSIRSGEDLLNALLDVATLESGKLSAQPVSFAIGQLIRRMAAEYAPQASAKGVDFRFLPCRITVRTDPVLLDRILRNLLSNAVRYTERGKILLGCRRRGNKLRIEVWDTGFGIPESQFDAIFEEFHQIENPARDRRQGLGLGLAIVERLAALLGHRVSVRSWIGRGSVFYLDVPIVAASRIVAPVEIDIADGQFSGVRVLVVEDDPLQRVGLEHIMAQWGAEVLSAASVDEALGLAAGPAARPDLVVADLRLPGRRTGFELIELLRDRMRESLPAIVLTGDTGEEWLRQSERRRCRLLHKPLDPNRLGQCMLESLSGL